MYGDRSCHLHEAPGEGAYYAGPLVDSPIRCPTRDGLKEYDALTTSAWRTCCSGCI